MLNLLAAVVEVTEQGGDKVVVDPMGPMLMSGVYLFLILLPLIVILLFFFYKKKLQHQQIMAAIEKGHPIADLLAAPTKKETGYVANISAGVGLIFVAIALLILYVPAGVYMAQNLPRNSLVVIPIVLIGLGITRLIRGIYQKKEDGKADDNKSEISPDLTPQPDIRP
jgi:hypothetical protein